MRREHRRYAAHSHTHPAVRHHAGFDVADLDMREGVVRIEACGVSS